MDTTGADQGFMSHLIELRSRLLRSVSVLLVFFVVLMFWANDLYDLLAQPMINTLPDGARMIATGVVTPFFVPLKVAFMVAFLCALPFILYQAWAFVAPGLYAHERRLGLPLVLGSTLLFLLGMIFCYFFVFGTVFRFIASFAPDSILPAPDIAEYLSFVMTMFIAFGVTFEVPVVVVLLAMAGFVSIEKLQEARPYVLVGAFVVAAIVTPPDVVSQFLLAVPMYILYELGVWVAKNVLQRRKQRDGGDIVSTG